MAPSSRFVSRAIFVLAALLAFSTMAQAASAQIPPPGNRMDLPGVIVTPLGLHAAGITGFGADKGVTYHTVEEVIADEFAASRGYMTICSVPGIQQLLTTSGWLQYHEQRYGMTDPADPGAYAQIFAIGIEQYASPRSCSTGSPPRWRRAAACAAREARPPPIPS